MAARTSVSTGICPNIVARHLLLEIRTRYVIDKMKDDRIGAFPVPQSTVAVSDVPEKTSIEQALEVQLDALPQPSRCIGVVDEFYAIGSHRSSAFLRRPEVGRNRVWLERV